MNPGEEVLSDVHINTRSTHLPGKDRSVTRFFFCFQKERHAFKKIHPKKDNVVPSCDGTVPSEKSTAQKQKVTLRDEHDDDNEFIPKRKKKRNGSVISDVLSPEHLEKVDPPQEKQSVQEGIPVYQMKEVRQDGERNRGSNSLLSDDKFIMVDEDGDLVVPRLKRKDMDENLGVEISWTDVIMIEHSLATELPDVGTQVWQGALILCDFVVNHQELFEKQVVVDLGAGTGLTSIVAGLLASKVFCTDTGNNILQLAKHNLDLNADLLHTQSYSVRELDWYSEEKGLHSAKGEFSLTKTDTEEILDANVLIAADVIYDDDITDAFFQTVLNLMSQGSYKTLYIGIEKRLVFTLTNLDIECPAYNYFQEKLHELKQMSRNGRQYLYSQIKTDFPQCFSYQKTKELELWKITSLPFG